MYIPLVQFAMQCHGHLIELNKPIFWLHQLFSCSQPHCSIYLVNLPSSDVIWEQEMCKIGKIVNLLYFHLVFLTVITCRSSYSSVKINGMGTFLTKYFLYLIALDGWLDYNQILNDYNIDSSNYNDDEYYEEVATPRAEASMEVEFLEEEEKIGPSLGRVLGKFGVKFCFQNDNCKK